MKGRCLLITMCLLASLLLTAHANAAFFNKNIKLSSLSTTDNGIVFTVKYKKDLTLSGECKNTFILPNTHAEYNLLAAFLLTASAQKKKVGIDYDELSMDCEVPVTSVTIY